MATRTYHGRFSSSKYATVLNCQKKKKYRPDGQTECPVHYLDTENSWPKAGRNDRPAEKKRHKKYKIGTSSKNTKWRGFSFRSIRFTVARLLFVLISGSKSHHPPRVFEVKSLCSTMPGFLFAGATLAALVGVVVPLLASYFFGGQITLYLSSPYGFRDIPDQTGALRTPHLPSHFTCIFNDSRDHSLVVN